MDNQKELVIYGKPGCPQCDSLKLRLDSEKIPYTYLVLNVDYGIKDLMEIKPVDVRTFPVSFVKYEHWHWKTIEYDYIKNDEITINVLNPQEN